MTIDMYLKLKICAACREVLAFKYVVIVFKESVCERERERERETEPKRKVQYCCHNMGKLFLSLSLFI